MLDERFIIIPNKLLYRYDKNNSLKVLILALLQHNMSIRNKCIFNVKWLLDKMNIKSNDSRRVKLIHKCLLELCSDGILIFDVDLTKLNNAELIFVECVCESNYVQILDKEFESIYNYSDQNVNTKDLLSLFAYIKSRIDEKGYCYPSLKLISEELGINSDTITKYNKILGVDLGLILIENIGDRVFFDGTVKTANNIYAINNEYGRKKLEQKVAEYKDQLSEQQIKVFKSKISSDKRSTKMKIHHLERRFNEGKIDDVEFSVRYFELNKKYEELVGKYNSLLNKNY